MGRYRETEGTTPINKTDYYPMNETDYYEEDENDPVKRVIVKFMSQNISCLRPVKLYSTENMDQKAKNVCTCLMGQIKFLKDDQLFYPCCEPWSRQSIAQTLDIVELAKSSEMPLDKLQGIPFP